MLSAKIVGYATATQQHAALAAHKMLIAQPLLADGRPDGFPLLVIDTVGAGPGDDVLLTSDGRFSRKVAGTDNTPARWTLIAIHDAQQSNTTQA